MSSAFLLALALLQSPGPQRGMAASDVGRPVDSIAAITRDLDRDGRPDRLGDTVRVAGRATVPSGVLHPTKLSLWIQSGGAAVQLYGSRIVTPVVPGDSIEATGVVKVYLGAPEVVITDYRVVPGARHEIIARGLPLRADAMQANDGRLAAVEGRITAWGSDGSGLYAVLDGSSGDRVALYMAAPIVKGMRIHEYGVGDRVRATGPLVPFEPPDMPATGERGVRHRVVVRGQADVDRIGSTHLTRAAVRTAVPVALVVALIVALIAVVFLRGEVRRHTRRLIESEQRYRSLYTYSPDAVAEYDLSGRVRAANAAFEATLGYTWTELEGRTLFQFVRQEDRAQAAEQFQAASRGEARDFDLVLHRKDGAPRTLGMTLMPVVVNGEITGVYGLGKDVTASAEARRELAASAQILSTVVETQQVIAAAELDVNSVAQRILEHVTRLTAADLAEIGFLEDDHIILEPHMRSRDIGHGTIRLPLLGSLSGEALRLGTVLRSNDALEDGRIDAESQRTLGFRSVIAVPLVYGGSTVGVLTVTAARPNAFDDADDRTLRLLAGLLAAALSHAREFEAKQELVAERTAALEALQASEERFRSVIEHASDPLMIMEASGTMVWASPANERVLGYRESELVSRNVFDFVHPDDAPGVMAALAEALSTAGGTGACEYRYRHKDGSWRVLASIGRNLLHDPAVRGIVVNSRDITEQRQLEEQLRHAQKMEAVGQLAGGVAHDFNNILTVIRVHSAFLLEALAARDPRRADAEEIQRASDRAAALTRQLLAFSRRQLLQPRVLDLNASITGVEPMLRRLIGEDISIVTRLAPDVGRITADRGQLEQVLMNLAVNSRDAMPDGGTLTVMTANVTVDESHPLGTELRPGRYALLSVSDTGIGMDAATRRRVFEPFFTTKEQGKGTGLGLATVYGVVQQSGGTVTVQSEPAAGSTFHVYLPCVPTPPEPEHVLAAPSAPIRGTETILIVEDEDAVRSLARRILGARGYRIIEARNGRDALEAARATAGEIHLVLTDVVMPEMGGRELAETLSAERPETRVLFMSGYTDDDILRRGLRAPGVAFLHKPFTVRDLTDAVRRTLDGVAATVG